MAQEREDLRPDSSNQLESRPELAPTDTAPFPAQDTKSIGEGGGTAAKTRHASLRVGEIVAGRFQILGGRGSGGMGFVYEALDRKLMEPRALKFARHGYDSRISEETRNSQRVTHENVCRIYEIHSAETSIGPADFISMELIDGETLYSALQRGPWPQARSLDVVKQLCRGLDAAHSAGIVHQDLKSNNVMLAQREDQSTRVVIMDFGLAFSPSGAENGGRPASSPHSIAAERYSGAPSAETGDLYALGVLLYEILTGALPFPRDMPQVERTKTLPPPPSSARRKPDARWDPIVLRCLEPDPRKRFQSARDVLHAIERTFEGHTRRNWIVAAASVGLIAALATAALRDKIWTPVLARIAVLPMEGSSGDAAMDRWLKGGLIDLGDRIKSLSGDSRRVVVIPVEDAVRYGVNSPGRAAASLGATHVFHLTLERKGSAVEVKADVRELSSGMTVNQFQGEFKSENLTALPTALAGVVTAALHLKTNVAEGMQPAAYRPYAEGLDRLRSAPPDVDKALELFHQALKIDPRAVPAMVGAADAHLEAYRQKRDAVNNLKQARSFAESARSLQPDSPAVLLSLAEVERLEGRPERAIELLRRATEMEPNNADAWLRTGRALELMQRTDNAVDALRHAVRLAPDYFAAHRDVGAIFFRIGRLRESAAEFQIVTRIAPGLAEGFSALGGVLLADGRDAEAENALRESVRLRASRLALNNLGVLLRFQGRNDEAASVLQDSVRVGLEQSTDDAGGRLNLGNALLAVGRKAEARAQFEKAAALARERLHINARDAASRAQLAYSMARLDGKSWAADEALQAAQLSRADYAVIFWAAMTLEALGRRSDIFPLLADAPYSRLHELQRQPDLAGLANDPRFVSLLNAVKESQDKSQRKINAN